MHDFWAQKIWIVKSDELVKLQMVIFWQTFTIFHFVINLLENSWKNCVEIIVIY